MALKIKRFIIVCGMIGILSGLPKLSLAGPYQPDKTIQIQSELSSKAGGSTEKQDILWSVTSRKNNDETFDLSFFMEGSDQPVCQLSVSALNGRIQSKIGSRSPDVILDSDLFISPGYPAPCDVLPVARMLGSAGEIITYDIKRQAGGSSFAEQLQVDCFPVDINEARKNGWVRTNVDATENLWMIRVRNKRTDAVMVRQLWPSTGSWWIYEETPYRRSWRM